MNDRYLFKAKDYMTDEWVIGSLIVMDWDSGYVYISKSYEHAGTMSVRKLLYNHTHLVKKETICQCTGLKDKNGNLIWGNDIIVYDGRKGVVRFDCYKWGESEQIGFYVDWDKIDYREDLVYWFNKISVIGSYIDNPELLEVE